MNLAVWVGADRDPQAEAAAMTYWVTTQGVFRCQTTPIGQFQLPWPVDPPSDIVPDPRPARPTVELAVPRIPARVLETITQVFRGVAPQERLLNCYWHPATGLWEIENPPQQTTAASVTLTTTRDPYHPDRPRMLQIHSHGHYPAVFSATDDADELACGLYAVLGSLDQPQPTLAVRAGMAGQFLPLDSAAVFAPEEGGS